MNEYAVPTTFIVCATIVIILCCGDPDILDGLIKMVNK